MRELDGAFLGAPAGWGGGGVIDFLITTDQATKGIRDALIRSHLPIGFLQVTAEGTVLQFIWNYKAAQQDLDGIGVTNRFTPQTEEQEPDEMAWSKQLPLLGRDGH